MGFVLGVLYQRRRSEVPRVFASLFNEFFPFRGFAGYDVFLCLQIMHSLRDPSHQGPLKMRMQTHRPCHVYSHGLALRQLLAKATRISPLGFACSLASTIVVPTAPEAVAFRTASLSLITDLTKTSADVPQCRKPTKGTFGGPVTVSWLGLSSVTWLL